jgi:SAM-dependent methyltransferase
MDYTCKYKICREGIKRSNSATNFRNPSLAVKKAIENEYIHPTMRILDFGAGNLRNSFYILDSIKDINIFAYDLEDTILRFRDRYSEFEKRSGQLLKFNSLKRKFDIIISTFVIETICPEKQRIYVLQSIRSRLKRNGRLILSLRGYPGVWGTKYKQCKCKEGLITPMHTFVKPYSLSESQRLLDYCGFGDIKFLQKYRVDTPQNIHLIVEKD